MPNTAPPGWNCLKRCQRYFFRRLSFFIQRLLITTTDTDFTSDTCGEVAKQRFEFTKFGKTATNNRLNRKHTSVTSQANYLNEINCVRLVLIFRNNSINIIIKKVTGDRFPLPKDFLDTVVDLKGEVDEWIVLSWKYSPY